MSFCVHSFKMNTLLCPGKSFHLAFTVLPTICRIAINESFQNWQKEGIHFFQVSKIKKVIYKETLPNEWILQRFVEWFAQSTNKDLGFISLAFTQIPVSIDLLESCILICDRCLCPENYYLLMLDSYVRSGAVFLETGKKPKNESLLSNLLSSIWT